MFWAHKTTLEYDDGTEIALPFVIHDNDTRGASCIADELHALTEAAGAANARSQINQEKTTYNWRAYPPYTPELDKIVRGSR